jgi:TorA maturation chaperone TorD
MGNALILSSLRDFFAARDGRAMAAACATLSKAAPPADGIPTSADTADELEYAFNRLFVGPGAVPAPPYASVYLDPERRLMGESTRIAAAVYDALGVSSPLMGSLPDDHLALELDAAVAFRALKAPEQSAELAALWDYFLRDHLMLWVPLFVACIRQEPDVPPAISHVASLLSAWLSDESGAKPLASAPAMYQPGGMA